MLHANYSSQKPADVAGKNTVMLDESTNLSEAAKLMREKQISSVLVSRNSQHVIGIVTERDILYRMIAEIRFPFNTTLKEIMSSPLITVDEATTVKDAIALMRKNAIRRVPIINQGRAVGMLTLRGIMGNNHNDNVELAEVELPAALESKVMYPYCSLPFPTRRNSQNI